MDSAQFSAVDAVRPALYRTKRLLFQPFRFGVWVRFAVVALLSGELSNGGLPNTNFHYNMPARSNQFQSAPFAWPSLHHMMPLLIALAFLFVALTIVGLWISSRFRFVLFESVITGDVHIRQGWKKWLTAGNSLFLWRLGYNVVMLLAVGLVVGLPVLLAWRAGIFRNASQHVLNLILGGLILGSVALAVIATAVAIWVLTKDFVVPIMVGQGISTTQAWRYLWECMKPAKGSYAGYLGMKLVLTLAAALAAGLVLVVAIIAIAIPVVIVALIVGIAVPAGSLAWNALTITLAIVAVLVAIAVVFCLICTIAVPTSVFFESYALHFFSARYEPLYQMMFPLPPPPPTDYVPPSGPAPEMA